MHKPLIALATMLFLLSIHPILVFLVPIYLVLSPKYILITTPKE